MTPATWRFQSVTYKEIEVCAMLNATAISPGAGARLDFDHANVSKPSSLPVSKGYESQTRGLPGPAP